MESVDEPRRRPRSLALDLVDALGERIRTGRLAPGDKLSTEAALMAEFGVSRTVVREALSKLQASGQVATRHGVGTFVVSAGEGAPFRIDAQRQATLRDVVAVLELRTGVESEAAALAAQRRDEQNLRVMREALEVLTQAVALGQDSVVADFRFHSEIARATQNQHFASLLASLGSTIIPRSRLDADGAVDEERRSYLNRVNAEHQSIFEAIANRDADGARAAMRTHLTNSRERRRRAAALDPDAS